MRTISTVPRGGLYDPKPAHGAAASRRNLMLVATLALGMTLFALFFGLVAACDRL
jgi:hypothetical protein